MSKTIIAGLSAALCMAASAAASASLINGGFETPVIPASPGYSFVPEGDVDGWTSTTETVIEIWRSGFNGVTAYEGDQFAEINANQATSLYQDVSGISAGATLQFWFAHRGREGTDTMQVDITDLGLDNIFGTGDDSILFTQQFSTGNSDWVFYEFTDSSTVTAQGNDVRFAYSAVSTGGTGDVSIGNFIDKVAFGTDIAAVPLPAGGLLLLGALGGLGLMRRRRG
jgi:hypothetical protein